MGFKGSFQKTNLSRRFFTAAKETKTAFPHRSLSIRRNFQLEDIAVASIYKRYIPKSVRDIS